MFPEMSNDLKDSESPIDGPAGLLRQADERALEILWAKGRKAWKDVKSATEWVEDLRGNQTEDEPQVPPGA